MIKKNSLLPQIQIIPSKSGLFPLSDKDLPKFLAKAKSHDEISIVFFGSPDFSGLVLKKLIDFCNSSGNPTNLSQYDVRSHTVLPKQFTIQAVVTRPDKPVGRKQTLTPTPVAQTAQKHNIPVLKPVKLDDDFLTTNYQLLNSDLFVISAYGKIIPQAVLDIPRYGSLNVHPSLLPKYRGPSPIQEAILNGDKETGVTIMVVDEEMDHGPIVSTKHLNLSQQDTFETLSNKLFQEGAELLVKTIPDFIEGKIKPIPQDDSKATPTKLLKKEDGYFDIENPPNPQTLERMIRAYYSWPGVWTKWKGKIVKFYPNKIVQMEGKKPMTLENFLNGYPDFPNPFSNN